MKSLNLTILSFVILMGVAPISLFAQKTETTEPVKNNISSFNFGLSYTNYSGFYMSDEKGNITSNDSYIGIGCSYFLGEKFTFYVGANFNFLIQMTNTTENDDSAVAIRVGKSIFTNISADMGIGIGYTFRFGKKSTLFVGGGLHTGLPHMIDSNGDYFYAFNLGIMGKVSYRFYNMFFIGAEIIYDFLLINPKYTNDTFQGVGIVPCIGFVYDF